MRSRVRSEAVVCALALVLVACSGSDPSGTSDGGAGGGGDGSIGADTGTAPPAEPAPVAPPSLACPPGWRSAAAAPGDPPTCHPYPRDEADTCGDGEAHFPGEPGCTVIGSPCPAGDFPEALPSDRPVVFVRAGAAAGGDGTETSPFATIAEAQAALPSGGVIALAKGSHTGAVRLRTNTVLWGACATQTVVTEPAASDSLGVIAVTDRGVVVRNVTISGPRPGIVVQSVLGELELEGVRVSGVRTFGVSVGPGARAIVRSTVVRDVAPTTGRNAGIAVAEASAALERVIVERAAMVGIAATAATLDIADVAVRRGEPRTDGTFGAGMVLASSTTATASRLVLEHLLTTGLTVGNAGTTVTLADIVIRDVGPQRSDRRFGRGLTIEAGGVVTLERAWASDLRYGGLSVSDVGSELHAADVVVTDVAADESIREGGSAITVQRGALAVIERAHAARSTQTGVFVTGSGSVAIAADLRVVDTRPQPSGDFGIGVLVQQGAHAEISRGAFERNQAISAFARDEGSTMIASDLLVRDTQPQAIDGAFGFGVQSQHGAAIMLTRARIEASHGLALGTAGGRFMISDLTIAGIEPNGRGVAHGIEIVSSTPGVLGGTPGDLEAERVVIAGAREVSLSVWFDSTARLSDLVIDGTRPALCTETGACSGGGIALGVYAGGYVDVRRFLLSHSALCGVQLATGGEIDLHQGTVSSNVCGANVQTEGFDVARLMDDVRYVDNETNLDATTLPVPQAGAEEFGFGG